MEILGERLKVGKGIYSGINNSVQKKRLIALYMFPDDDIDLALSKMEYFIDNNRLLDLDHPMDISSKLHWLKLNFRREDLGFYVDKIKARDIVQKKIGKKYLPICYWIGRDLATIDKSKIPEKFVLKVNNSWGKNIFCFDKSSFDWIEAASMTKEWLKDNHYLMHGEWAYSQVDEPMLILEEFLEVEGKIPDDYKIYCFNGEPKLIKYDSGRDKVRMQMHLDIGWDILPFHNCNYERFHYSIPKPKNLSEMLDISKQLSENLPFVRVDLYNVKGKVYFGEFTLYPCGGNLKFTPDHWNYIVGDYLDLSIIN